MNVRPMQKFTRFIIIRNINGRDNYISCGGDDEIKALRIRRIFNFEFRRKCIKMTRNEIGGITVSSIIGVGNILF